MSDKTLDPKDALEHILSFAKSLGATQADGLYGDDDSLSVEVFEGAVKSIETSRSAGLGLRVFVDGRPGYSFTERLTREAVERCARDAVDLASLTDELLVDLPQSWTLPSEEISAWSPLVAPLDVPTMVDWCRQAEETALAGDARVFNVPHLGAGRSSGYLMLANSNGLQLARRNASCSLGIGVVAKAGEGAKMGIDVLATLNPSEIHPRDMAALAVQRATSLLDAKSLGACEMAVLFDERVSASILGIFSGIFVGENVQKGQSRLAGREGQKIAASVLTISTQPHLPRQAGSRLFDGEGVATRSRAIVEDGVLQGFLHNLESARRAGCAPTGDAQRGYSGKVGAGFSNLVVPKGTQSFATLAASHERVLHVVKLEGATGCNSVSGEISIGVQGFLYENGVLVHPVDRITVSGNFFELLERIEALGDTYRLGLSSSFVPAILVSRMAVGG